MVPATELKAKPCRNRLPASQLFDRNNGGVHSTIFEQVLANESFLDVAHTTRHVYIPTYLVYFVSGGSTQKTGICNVLTRTVVSER